MLGAGLPVLMYTTKTPIDMWRFNVPQLKEFLTFSVNDRCKLNYFICLKDFNCNYIDNYFFKIVVFLYLLPSSSWKENNLSWYIFVIRQTVEYRTPAFTLPFSWRLHITITYNLSHPLTGTCGQDPIWCLWLLLPLHLFFGTSIFFHVHNILQLSIYHWMTYIQ
jgi:hypothetical protein